MRKYDNYKDSGIEWIGQVPKHWNLSKVKFLFDTQKGKTPKKLLEKFEEDTLVYLAMDYLRGEPKQIFYVSSEENVVLTDEGETLLLWDGSNAGEFLKSKKGVLSSTMALIKSQIVNNQFQWYSFKSFESILKDSCNGMGIPHVDGKFLRGSIFLLPPFDEQTTIANYLDQKTTQIDDLIAKKERLIQLLQEERIAIINQAVTKGLDPNVPMKDSGIEWLGEIPAHWEVKSFRFCIDILTDYTANGSFASLAENVTYYDTGYSRLVRLTDLRVDLVNEGLYVDEHAHNFLKKSELFGGEILIANVGAYAGLVMQMPLKEGKFTLGPNMFLVRLNQNTEFFLCQLNAPFCAEQLKMMSVSSAQPKLNKENIRQLKVVTPPIEEQNLIANHILKEKNRIETIAVKTQQEIELLKEYKTALISEVVTGKVDVRNEILN